MSSQSPIIIDPSNLPVGDNLVFENSSFFTQKKGSLPTPAEVLAQPMVKEGKRVALFHSIGVAVKYDEYTSIAEGQCLWAIRRYLPEVPVPEVFGWRHEGREFFIYMSIVPGVTLEDRWPSLMESERISVCEQLNSIMRSLRRFRQDPSDLFVGHIGRQPVQDILFYAGVERPIGPFNSSDDFWEFYAREKQVEYPPDFWNQYLSKQGPLTFTQNDLNRANIMVTSADDGRPIQITALIDFFQSGWYPRYWEFCKAKWVLWKGPGPDSGWDEFVNYLDRFLDCCTDDEYNAWNFFTSLHF